ncbi:hypothetical protein SDC9_137129 [bioreactor metagenome]|uniref:Uncharacterized protein n=1 Tax=bioreactor metagenome TaxID=1076179 RepID=A0A645DMJ6_9ZZZZ
MAGGEVHAAWRALVAFFGFTHAQARHGDVIVTLQLKLAAFVGEQVQARLAGVDRHGVAYRTAEHDEVAGNGACHRCVLGAVHAAFEFFAQTLQLLLPVERWSAQGASRAGRVRRHGGCSRLHRRIVLDRDEGRRGGRRRHHCASAALAPGLEVQQVGIHQLRGAEIGDVGGQPLHGLQCGVKLLAFNQINDLQQAAFGAVGQCGRCGGDADGRRRRCLGFGGFHRRSRGFGGRNGGFGGCTA